ncbi:MBL fold metallo-hydrolase [Bacillus sp. Marseille-P3661]|uniref:MBL fold metallo-hydrolase n=1 Tax=Bacillus sp. Marseille-P3661 TaxID=1936234 RepID=UPI000C84F0E0|nr:MBL fold metallo-hydrolase [Bacillus sp. Marseille-P3661]
MIIHKTNNVTVFQSALFQLNTTIVITDDLVLVVDPGYLPSEIDGIRSFVDEVKGNRPIYLFFTHSDFDHIVGYGSFPDAKTIASEQFLISKQKEKQLEDAIHYDHEFYIIRPYELIYPNIDYVIKGNGQQLKIGKTLITFYHAFGHNDDGLIAVFESEKLVIVGDYLSDIEFPFVYFSFKEYGNTLTTLKNVFKDEDGKTLITSHGNVTQDSMEIKKRFHDSYEYLELVKRQASENHFEQYLAMKKYRFTTIFRKRHKDNLDVWRKEFKTIK